MVYGATPAGIAIAAASHEGKCVLLIESMSGGLSFSGSNQMVWETLDEILVALTIGIVLIILLSIIYKIPYFLVFIVTGK